MSQNKSLKREREEESQDPCKKERLLKMNESESEGLNKSELMDLEEISKLIDKDGGLSIVSAVNQILRIMYKEEKDCLTKNDGKVSWRVFLSGIIVATKDEECLSCFLQLGCMSVLDEWLHDAHKSRFEDDQDSIDAGEKRSDELILTLLGALGKLPIDLEALKGCSVGNLVSNLQDHTNPEIQKKAAKLVDRWKISVDAETRPDGDESKHRLDPVAGKQSLDEGSVDEDESLKQSMAMKEALLQKESSMVVDVSGGATTHAKEERNHTSSHYPNSDSCLNISVNEVKLQKDDANCVSEDPILESSAQTQNDLAKEKQVTCLSTAVSEEKTRNCNDVHISDTHNENKEIIYPCKVENSEYESSELRMEHGSGEKPSGAGNLEGIKSSLGADNVVIGRDIDLMASTAACGGSDSERYGLSKNCIKEDLNNLHESNAEGGAKDIGSFPKDLEDHCGASTSLMGKADEDLVQVRSEFPLDDMNACVDKTEADNHDEQGCNDSERETINKISSSLPVKGQDSVDEYEEEDALEIARWVAKEVEQEVGSRVESPTEDSPSSPQTSDKNENTLVACDCIPEASSTKRKEMESDSVAAPICGLEPAETLVGRESTEKTETKITLKDGDSSVSEASLVATCDAQGNQAIVPVALSSTSSIKSEAIKLDIVTNLVCALEEPAETTMNKGIDQKEARVDLKAYSSLTEDDLTTTSISGCQPNRALVSVVPAETLVGSEGIGKKEAMVAPMCRPSLTEDSLIVTSVRGVEADQVLSQGVSASVVDNDSDGGAVSTRPIFDLNEGFASDDMADDDPSVSTITTVSAHISAPIAVVAIANGFTPPSDLVRSTENLGWKGSASTSAFRQAEPRRACETPPTGTDKEALSPTVKDKTTSERPPNTTDEAQESPPTALAKEAHVPIAVGTTTEACEPPPVGITKQACGPHSPRIAEEAQEPHQTATGNEACEQAPIIATKEVFEPPPIITTKESLIGGDDLKCVRKLDIDLNVADDILLEEDVSSVMGGNHSLPNVGRLEFDLNMVEESEEATVPTIESTGVAVRMVRDFDLNDGPGVEDFTREELNPPSAIPVGVRTRVDYGSSHSLHPLHPMVMFSGSGGESTYSVPPPRKGATLHYPPSSSYNVSPFERIVRVIEVPRSDPSSSWSRPSLDLNAGPDADLDPPSKWQSSSFPFQQGSSSSVLKRKEPDGGFDPFRSGLKQMVGPPSLFPPSS